MTDNFQNQPLTDEDVVAAYRWVLGRDPESAEKVAAHLSRNGSVSELRHNFLRAPEFSRALDRLAVLSQSAQQAVNATDVVERRRRLLFLHIPKTAGSSLHQAFEAVLPENSLCPVRQNLLLTRPIIELGRYRAYFGHYDMRLPDLLPGRPYLLTMLREPGERLVSLYRYLRSHTAERAKVEALELARIARNSDFADFLHKARQIAPASVDNTYVRTLAGALPLRRWEDRAEADWLAQQSADVGALLPAARIALDRFDAVGIVEKFSASLAAFNRVLAGAESMVEVSIEIGSRQQVTDVLADVSPGFEAAIPRAALQPQVEAAADLIAELTDADNELYARASFRLNDADE